jgi:hypothetical protein
LIQFALFAMETRQHEQFAYGQLGLALFLVDIGQLLVKLDTIWNKLAGVRPTVHGLVKAALLRIKLAKGCAGFGGSGQVVRPLLQVGKSLQ